MADNAAHQALNHIGVVDVNGLAGLRDLFSPHSFRVTVVTDLLNQNIALEDVQYLAGHSSPSTTRVYDRRRRKVTRNLVEKISI